MKIYIDGELPKNCTNCPFYKLDTYTNTDHTIINNYRCILYGSILTGNCPLETTQSLKQQVREDVVDEIKEKIKNIKENIWTYYGEYGLINDMDYGQIYGLNKLLRILDQLKGKCNE